MQKKVLTILSAVALSTPALAADLSTSTYVPPSGDPVYSPTPMVVGHLELGLGLVNFSEDDFDETNTLFSGAGRANIPFAGGAWNVELEVGGGSTIFDDSFSWSTIGAAGHLWTKLNSAALGVYGGVNFPTGLTVGTLGVEGEAYFGAFTLGANADYNWADCGGGCDFDFWTVRGYADAYVTPDFRVGGELAYASFDDSGPETWTAALDAEYRFSGTPFSVWGEGSYTNADFGGGDLDAWAGMIGFRVFMDGAGTTLQQHDREVPWDSGLLGNGLLGGLPFGAPL